MKKLFSLFTVVAVIFSMFAITASANDTVFDLDVAFASEKIEVGADGASTVTITFKPNFDASDEPICAGEFYFTPSGFVINGVNSVEGTGLAASAWATYESEGYTVLSWATSTDGEGIVSDYKVVLDITVDTASEKELSLATDTEEYSYGGSVYGTYYVVPGTLTITKACAVESAGGNDEPAGNKMVALVNTDPVQTENTDGWQKGQGIAATFNVADIKDFTAMNWVLTCENIAAPKYAKVDNFAELIAAIGEESTVQFVATFVVNAIENKVETVYAIKDVAAGFKPVEGEPVIFTAE